MKLVAVGDILLGAEPPPWRDEEFLELVHNLREGDLVLGNMESPLINTGFPIQKLDIARTDRFQAKELSRMGFSAMTLANNHIWDYGVGGLKSTQRTLRKAGIEYAGAGTDAVSAFRHVLLEVNGRKVAFIGAHAYYHDTWEHYPDPYRADHHKPGAAVIQGYKVRAFHPDCEQDYVAAAAPSERFLQHLLESIEKARQEADTVVLALHSHWGKHDLDQIDVGRRIITHEAVRAGVDLIVGHGPHVFNGIEYFEGAFIVHSLGNFFFHMPLGLTELIPEVRPFIQRMQTEDRFWEGLLLETVFENGARPTSLRLHPCDLDRSGPGTPRPASAKVAERMFERLKASSAPLGVDVRMEDGVFVAEPSGTA